MSVSGDLREIHADDTQEDQPIESGMTVRTRDGVGRVVSNPFIDQNDGMECVMVAIPGKWHAKSYNTQDLEVIYVGRDRISGEPYQEGQEPLDPEQAREVIVELRKAIFPGYADRVAQAVANETGLEVDQSDKEEYQHLHGWEDSQADQDYWQRVLAGQE